MDVKCVIYVCFTQFIFLLLTDEVRPREADEKGLIDGNNDRGCAYLHCEGNDVCVHRKFRCKEPPCPSMLYCAKSHTESLKGPSTCDTVKCTMGYVCMLKVRRCHWDNRCQQQIGRCVSRKEYFESPASCAGYKCPQGNHCILRESLCANPPCKLLRSCAKNKDVHLWFGTCRSLGCPSEYECFLRRPESDCANPPCKHTPDCITTGEDQMANEHCLGWVCPRMQACSAEIVEGCESDDCQITRTCHHIDLTSDSIQNSTNDTSSFFSRRSLKKEDQLSPNDSKVSSPEKSDIERSTPSRTTHTWLDHLSSKTELDAIELWVMNADGQNDFEQFREWLRSIKNILDPTAYNHWLKENLSSRGEEFRKWLQASHESLETEGPIFTTQEKPPTPKETPNPAQNAMNTSPGSDSEKKIQSFDSFLNEENLANIIEQLSTPNKVPEPSDNAFDSESLSNLGGSNRSPFFNFLLKYPSKDRDHTSTMSPPEINSNQELLHSEDLVKNMRELGNSSIIQYNSVSKNLNQMTTQNGEGSREEISSSVFKWNNLSFTKEEISSIWSGLHETTMGDLPLKEANFNDDSIVLPEDKKLMDKAQYFNDISLDSFEKLLKSLYFTGIENVSHHFANQPRQESPTTVFENEPERHSFRWNVLKQSEGKQDTSHDQFLPETATQFVSRSNTERNSTSDLEQRIGILLDKLARTETFNDSGYSDDINSELPFQHSMNNEEDTMDLNFFLEQNKENVLPYMQALLDAINQENNPSSPILEPHPDESSVNNFFINNSHFGWSDELRKKLQSARLESRNIFTGKVSNNPSRITDSHLLETQKLDRTFPTQHQMHQGLTNLKFQQVDDSNKNEESTIRIFDNLPSYGASDGGDTSVQDFIFERDNITKSKEDI